MLFPLFVKRILFMVVVQYGYGITFVKSFQISMSVFDQLSPFVRLCQACGFIPYKIEYNLTTHKFSKFTFSMKHRSTWWFVWILVLQVASICLTGYISANSKHNDIFIDQSLPITFYIFNMVHSISNVLQYLLSYRISMRYRRLQTAIQAVQKVERLLGEKFIAQHKNSLTTRFVIGFILMLIANAGLTLVAMPLLPSVSPENPTVLLVIIILFLAILSLWTMFESTFLFIHLCYYIISHYIKIIFLPSEKYHDDENLTGAENLKVLRQNALIFDTLCGASFELNRIFSVPVFVLLTTKFLSVIYAAFIYIYNFIHSNDALENYSLFFSFLFFLDWVHLLVILTAADMPVNQVRLLRERLTKKLNSTFSRTSAEKIAVMTIWMQIDEERVRLSAAGLFNVGVHLIPALTGAVVTYMVILLKT